MWGIIPRYAYNMRITHSVHGVVRSEEGEGGVLLLGKTGDYFLQFGSDFTAYQGYFVFLPNEFDYVKLVDSFRLESPCTKVTNRGYEVDCEHSQSHVGVMVDEAGLLYAVDNYEGEVAVDLDVRRIHDFDDQGRIYRVFREGEFVVVEYTKFSDGSLSSVAYRMFVVFLWRGGYEIVGRWKGKSYAYDAERGTKSELFVFDALRFLVHGSGKIIVVGSGNLTQAKVKALHVEKRWKEELEKGNASSRVKRDDVALVCAEESCKQLTVHPQPRLSGILAGLPWFFQFWTRDELISSVYLLSLKRYGHMRDILMKYVNFFGEDGRLPNRLPHADLGSADGIGWLGKRMGDLIFELKSRDELDRYFSRDELGHVYRKLKDASSLLRNAYGKDGLIVNRPKETWMDTDFGGDVRDGARIEIQTLQLALYSCINFLGKELDEKTNETKTVEKLLREKVKTLFFDGKRLADGFKDGSADWTGRPNVFIAYYCYPGLLSKKEWKAVFSSTIEKLWLPWGGLSTIAKDHPLFCDTYSGMDNRSYHRGDSWFFINNMAAICMHDIDNLFFKEYIDKIRQASSREILFSGAIGHHAEVSSAKELSSKGCLAQAWSAALFVEMCARLDR